MLYKGMKTGREGTVTGGQGKCVTEQLLGMAGWQENSCWPSLY